MANRNFCCWLRAEVRGGNRYSLEEFGLEADSIHKELAELFDRFSWDERDEGGDGNGGNEDGPSVNPQ